MDTNGLCCECFDHSLQFKLILTMKLWILACLCSLKSLMVFCENLYGNGVCLNKLLNTRLCCKDFKLIGNKCVECNPGYRGYNCSLTCPPNFYGRRCLEKCKCLSYQYCDAEMGCLCNTTSDNCTDPGEISSVQSRETGTVEIRQVKTTTVDIQDANDKTNKKYLLEVTISSVISIIFLFATGVSCLSIWIKRRLREAKKERHTLRDQPLLHVENTSSGPPQPHQTRDYPSEDIYAHATSGIYNHLSLRVQLSSLSDSDNRENPSLCPGPSPDTISEQSEERIRTEEKESQTDIHTDSENSEEVYFDVSYVGQNSGIVKTDETVRCSLKSDT